jgi:hypothetical protein
LGELAPLQPLDDDGHYFIKSSTSFNRGEFIDIDISVRQNHKEDPKTISEHLTGRQNLSNCEVVFTPGTVDSHGSHIHPLISTADGITTFRHFNQHEDNMFSQDRLACGKDYDALVAGGADDDLKEVLDFFRDEYYCPSIVDQESSFNSIVPHTTPSAPVKVSPVKTSQGVPKRAVTFDEDQKPSPTCQLQGQNEQKRFRRMHVSPSPRHEPEVSTWLIRQMGSKVPILPESSGIISSIGGGTCRSRNCASDLTRHKHWTEEEDLQLRLAVEKEGGGKKDWKRIARSYFANTRSGTQCKVRWKNHLKPGILRGNWQPHEDALIVHMAAQGDKWAEIASRLPGRIGENVRERYVNVLDPRLKKTPWTDEEDRILFENQRVLGNKWSEIRKLIPGRSENSIKNRYHNRKNSYLRKMTREVEEHRAPDEEGTIHCIAAAAV